MSWKGKNNLEHRQLRLAVSGIVQGVGFRPAAFNLANNLGLVGSISNHGDEVSITLEGPTPSLRAFQDQLKYYVPKTAEIDSICETWGPAEGLSQLSIVESNTVSIKLISTPPDQVICQACRDEFSDSSNRRYLYPFISCSECGPKYSIVEFLPYDRKNTSSRDFSLCGDCKKEFSDPFNRRFYAQNINCFRCGPEIELLDEHGNKIPPKSVVDQVSFLNTSLNNDKIIAVKGIGGFQLICNARSNRAIEILRQRKMRPHKALAVMVRDDVLLSESLAFMEAIKGTAGPIVVSENDYGLPLELIAPDSLDLGLMLPTTGLHRLLFGKPQSESHLDFLVVTSGNISDCPMLTGADDAVRELSGVADIFVTHNRGIVRSVDDSLVLRVNHPQGAQVTRNGRGYAPTKISIHGELAAKNIPKVLALGGDFKNTFCLAAESKILMSPHIGNLTKVDSYKLFKSSVQDFIELNQFIPEVLAVDLHPDYLSSVFGEAYARQEQIPVVKVQHHVAHASAVMTEHGLTESINLVFDGTGYGNDQTLWGGECLVVDLMEPNWERVASLELSSLLGGEKAVLEPRRQIYTRLRAADIPVEKHPKWEMLYKNMGMFPKTSSMGRLFDSVSSLLLSRYETISYEGQAAIGLECHARKSMAALSYDVIWEEGSNETVINTSYLLAQIYRDFVEPCLTEDIAFGFHVAAAKIGLMMVEKAKRNSGIDMVCLSGGAFQNKLLSELMRNLLEENGYRVFEHCLLPPGDGGICVGQAVYAASVIIQKREKKEQRNNCHA